MSRDLAFAEKVADVVGLYLDPPAGAVVLSIDEKTQIQALDDPADASDRVRRQGEAHL